MFFTKPRRRLNLQKNAALCNVEQLQNGAKLVCQYDVIESSHCK